MADVCHRILTRLRIDFEPSLHLFNRESFNAVVIHTASIEDSFHVLNFFAFILYVDANVEIVTEFDGFQF